MTPMNDRSLLSGSPRRTAALLAVILVFVANPGASAAQQLSRSNAAAVTGTWAIGTRHFPSSGRDGCWLESAPITADSVRLQVLCRYPAPAYHLGVLDARLRMIADTVVYETREYDGTCRIRVRFAGARVFVEQEGSDIACGFGASVNVGGTYTRLSRRRPPFDLAPIERASPRRRASPRSSAVTLNG